MPTPPRNAPCPCGSGRKYKFCCALTTPPGQAASPAAPSAEAALAQAAQLHQAGRTMQAERLCLTILDEHPGHAEALHLLGLLRQEQGKPGEALELLEKAAHLAPDTGPLRNNLGELCRRAGRLEEAIGHFQHALSVMGHTPELDRNIGLILLDLGQTDGALDHLAASHQLHPGDVELLRLWGNALASAARPEEAMARFEQGLAMAPDHTGLIADKAKLLAQQGGHDAALDVLRSALRRHPDQTGLLHTLAQLGRNAGQTETASSALRRILELDPTDTGAAHDLAALTQQTPSTTPPEHVRAIFDYYAPGFEQHLQERLHYDTPDRLAALLHRHRPGQTGLDVLDLGCGTGLMGQKLHAQCSILDGIDLSPRMLDVARQKGIYSRLTEGELVACLRDIAPDSYGLVTAADVLNYLGDLGPTFSETARVLTDDGHFLFSVELPEAPADNARYRLGHSGRFQHVPAHIERLALDAGFTVIACETVELRQENGLPVMGGLYLLTRTSAQSA